MGELDATIGLLKSLDRSPAPPFDEALPVLPELSPLRVTVVSLLEQARTQGQG